MVFCKFGWSPPNNNLRHLNCVSIGLRATKFHILRVIDKSLFLVAPSVDIGYVNKVWLFKDIKYALMSTIFSMS